MPRDEGHESGSRQRYELKPGASREKEEQEKAEGRSGEKTGAFFRQQVAQERMTRPWKIGPRSRPRTVAEAASAFANDGCHVTRPFVLKFIEWDMASSGHE